MHLFVSILKSMQLKVGVLKSSTTQSKPLNRSKKLNIDQNCKNLDWIGCFIKTLEFDRISDLFQN